MNYELLNDIVSKFIVNNKTHVSTIDELEKMSLQLLQKDEPQIVNENWSRRVELIDSIDAVYSFLLTIDKQLADQFINNIRYEDDRGMPIVEFRPKTNNLSGESHVSFDGIVHIFYQNNPDDAPLILHEMMHKLNECRQTKTDESGNPIIGSQYETTTRDYFGESVSITAELLLANYLVQSGFITKSDFDIIKAERIRTTRENARDVIVNVELIKMKLSGKEITYDNAVAQLEQYDKTSLIYRIIMDEFHDTRRLQSIIRNGRMDLGPSQRYVIAQFLSEEIINGEDTIGEFLKMHYAVSDPNSDINQVINEIRKRYHKL